MGLNIKMIRNQEAYPLHGIWFTILTKRTILRELWLGVEYYLKMYSCCFINWNLWEIKWKIIHTCWEAYKWRAMSKLKFFTDLKWLTQYDEKEDYNFLQEEVKLLKFGWEEYSLPWLLSTKFLFRKMLSNLKPRTNVFLLL
jgi:hypothetical protein